MVPSDMFADMPADDPVIEAAPDEPAGPGDDIIDAPEPIADPPVEDEPLAAEPEPAEAVAEPQPAAVTEEELPEGVRKGKDRNGKEGYFLQENRYKAIYDNHKLVQEATEILGEPLTAEALKLRNDAYRGQERMFGHLTLGDPKEQTEVVSFLVNEMNGARENGETAVDPTVPFAESVYNVLHDKFLKNEGGSEGFAHLRLRAGKDFIGDMFDHAARTNDLPLYYAAQHFARALANIGQKPADMTDAQFVAHAREVTTRAGIPFHTPDEMQGLVKAEDPSAALARENADLKAQLNGRARTGTAAQYDTWSKASIQTVNKAVFDDAVLPALQSVADDWKKFPDDFKRLVTDPLHREVSAAVRADPVLNQQVKDLTARAARATSEQVRNQIGTQIRQLFVNRAKLAAEKAKTPILKFAADALKGRSDQTHERLRGAQARTAPKGTSAPVRSSVLPADMGFKDGIFDVNAAAAMATREINSVRR